MLEYFISNYSIHIILLIMTGLTTSVVMAIRSHLNSEHKMAIAREVALFAQQVYKALDGPAKMKKALEKAEALLKKKGIQFDADEMMVHIEAAVAELKEVFKEPLELEDSTDDTEGFGAEEITT